VVIAAAQVCGRRRTARASVVGQCSQAPFELCSLGASTSIAQPRHRQLGTNSTEADEGAMESGMMRADRLGVRPMECTSTGQVPSRARDSQQTQAARRAKRRKSVDPMTAILTVINLTQYRGDGGSCVSLFSVRLSSSSVLSFVDAHVAVRPLVGPR
jgi:hypothetical protein